LLESGSLPAGESARQRDIPNEDETDLLLVDHDNGMSLINEGVVRAGENKKERLVHIDWLKWYVVVMVVFVHSLNSSFDRASNKASESTIYRKEAIIRCLVQIGMPLMFYISGVSSTFIPEEETFIRFAKKKAVRLLVPLLWAIPLFLIPRLYLGQDFEPWARINPE